MSNMTKQIIKVATEIAQIVEDKCRNAKSGEDAYNAAFVASVIVFGNHPELFDPDFAPITVDLGMFPPKPADHPKAFPVFCGDVVKFGTNQPAIDGFTVGKLYRVVGTSFDIITTTCNGEDYIDHYRHQFFMRFDPAPQPAPEPDVMLFNKADIESGKLDGCKVWPEYCNVWLSPVDGKPHYVDPEGWIYARGYNPVKSDTILTDRQYMAEFKVKKNKEGAIPAEAAFWRRLLRFKLA